MSKLHYLYEQQGDGRQRFVYYCSGCSCVLKVRRNLGLANEDPSLNGRCMGCGLPLEGNIECRFAPVPEEWADLYHDPMLTSEKKPSFAQASSLPHFSLSFPPLDCMLRPLAPGSLVLLSGGPSSAVAELAAFRAQLPIEAGGLDSGVVFIDGGNRSDPYLFSSFAKQRLVKPSVAMRRVATCRVFTFYQLADLVSGHLANSAEDYAARLVIISDLLGTFNEPELDEREARRVLSAIEFGLQQTKKGALVMVTLASPSKYDDIVASWADTHVSLWRSNERIEAELVKHRTRPPVGSSFKLGQLLMSTARRER